MLGAGLASTGCGSKAVPIDTGARDAVQSYFEALLGRDSDRAYGVLDPESQARVTLGQFAELTKKYGNLGFAPQSVKIRSCDEQGNIAIAHVFLMGKSATKERRYRDGVSLLKTEHGWRVVLPRELDRH
jgi:hypothetical protein